MPSAVPAAPVVPPRCGTHARHALRLLLVLTGFVVLALAQSGRAQAATPPSGHPVPPPSSAARTQRAPVAAPALRAVREVAAGTGEAVALAAAAVTGSSPAPPPGTRCTGVCGDTHRCAAATVRRSVGHRGRSAARRHRAAGHREVTRRVPAPGPGTVRGTATARGATPPVVPARASAAHRRPVAVAAAPAFPAPGGAPPAVRHPGHAGENDAGAHHPGGACALPAASGPRPRGAPSGRSVRCSAPPPRRASDVAVQPDQDTTAPGA